MGEERPKSTTEIYRTKKRRDSDLSMSAGCAFDRIDAYHADSSKMYGPMPTEYQRGVLQGLECARSLVAYERDRHNVEDTLK